LINFLKYSLISILILALSCSREKTFPKPKSYLRIDLPEKDFYDIKDSCMFSFKLPDYASWEQKFKDYPECSKTIIFPEFKAEVLCEYFELNDNLLEMSEGFRKMVYEHSFKSSAILERVWKNEDEKVFALAYEIKGNTACNYAFTITDSSKHFFSGQLLFQAKPNYDSLKPCINFIIEDLEEMISSFQWIN
jgi:gliding motility-associated lipoprotein GldD